MDVVLESATALRKGKFKHLETFWIDAPPDYDQDAWLQITRQHCVAAGRFDQNLTDANFGAPSDRAYPGQWLRVEVHQQESMGALLHRDRLEFLKSIDSLFLGAYGAALVLAQASHKLPRDLWCASHDFEKNLWSDASGEPRVPILLRNSLNTDFLLGYARSHWYGGGCVLSFHADK